MENHAWKTAYPRPQMQRSRWLPLLDGWTLDGTAIQLPFPPQAPASGYQGIVGETLCYRNSFLLPDGFLPEGQRLLLHFGAVDQVAEVVLNGQPVCRHEGGYLPFTADITDYVQAGANVLQVTAEDSLSHDYPYGKQKVKRGGMWYTPVSGIWQTVWLETVPTADRIEKLLIRTDTEALTLQVVSDAAQCLVEIETPEGKEREHIPCGQEVRLPIRHPRLWSPEDPYLYRFTVTTEQDTVQSYFALRQIDIRQVGNHQRICLNGKPIFLHGLLDQGYYPEGIFLPESPEHWEEDIRRVKALGFNTLRKHVKVEPELWYAACDRLGILVMQDMVNSGHYSFFWDTALPNIGLQKRPDWLPGSRKRRKFFRQHCLDTVAALQNHPSVILYTIFNEGWGEFHADAMYRTMKDVVADRLVIATSGWFHQKDSDIDTKHVYFRNKALHPGTRPMLLTECGGYTRPIEGHVFNTGKVYGYGQADTETALTERIAKLYTEMVLPAVPEGLCGCIYTQISDVEDEVNGLYTYDRQVCKVNSDGMQDIARRCAQALQEAAAEKQLAEKA